MKLLSASASPFVAKVRMAALFAGLDVQAVDADSNNEAPELLAINPLGKIPCLVLDDGQAVFDSRVITRHLDRLSDGKLYPSNADMLLETEIMEALCDGICDSAVAFQYEMRFRDQEMWSQSWMERQWGKAERGLDMVSTMLPPFGANAHIGSIALFATLGYLDLRFSGRWEEGRLDLVGWRDAFANAHPEMTDLKPNA